MEPNFEEAINVIIRTDEELKKCGFKGLKGRLGVGKIGEFYVGKELEKLLKDWKLRDKYNLEYTAGQAKSDFRLENRKSINIEVKTSYKDFSNTNFEDNLKKLLKNLSGKKGLRGSRSAVPYVFGFDSLKPEKFDFFIFVTFIRSFEEPRFFIFDRKEVEEIFSSSEDSSCYSSDNKKRKGKAFNIPLWYLYKKSEIKETEKLYDFLTDKEKRLTKNIEKYENRWRKIRKSL